MIDLQEIRLRSISDGASHRLQFVLDGGSYVPQRRLKRTYEDIGAPISLPPGVTIEECTALSDSISFQPRGNAGTFGTITLANNTGRLRQVIVDMVGRVRIQ